MRFLIIGGTGFIGAPIARELLAGGHSVAIFHRGSRPAPQGADSIIGDRIQLAEFAPWFRTFRPDAVLDCILSDGAQAAALLEVFRGMTDRIVALSSQDVYRAVSVVYGVEEGLEPLPLTENSPLRTKMHPYPPPAIAAMRSVFPWLTEDYDKIPVERAIRSDPELPGTVLRLPMVYGPGDPLRRFHPVLKRIDDGRSAILMGEQAAAWRGTRGYVENVAAAVALALTSPRSAGRIYNVGDPDTLTEAEWAGAVAAATGWSGRIVILPDRHLPKHLIQPYRLEQHWVTDTARIRAELGYRDPLPRAEAIARTIAWDRAHPIREFPFAAFDYAAEDAALGADHSSRSADIGSTRDARKAGQ